MQLFSLRQARVVTLAVFTTVGVGLPACDTEPDSDVASRTPAQPPVTRTEVTPSEAPLRASGRIYLPTYSHIYSRGGGAEDLATTISIRNVSTHQGVELDKVSYYDTEGHLIEDFLDQRVRVAPLGTVEFFIPALDQRGGSGANVVVSWHAESPVARPLVEAVMLRSSGSHAYAFSSRGVDIRSDTRLPGDAPAASPTIDPTSDVDDAESGDAESGDAESSDAESGTASN